MEEYMFFRMVLALLNCGVGLVIGAIGVLRILFNLALLLNGGPIIYSLGGIALGFCVLISAESVLMPQRTIRRPELTLWFVFLGMALVLLALALKLHISMEQDEHHTVMIGSIMGICLVWGQLTMSHLLRIKFRWNRRNA